MNKKLGMAVAGAVMAFGATAANAGITIPAGDWTIDIGGNVNAYYTNYDTDTKTSTITRQLTGDVGFSGPNCPNGAGCVVSSSTSVSPEDANTIGTGLLPAAIGIGGKTRQNDLDIAFQFTFWTGTSSGAGSSVYGNDGRSALSGNELNIRQAFMTFGDASWGSIKMGRDLGIFGSDAILSDMTLLGVGLGSPGGSSTLGRIGQGYIYADWKGQISYTSPNWNGFSFAAGLMEGYSNGSSTVNTNNLGFEGKVNYEWAGDFAGKVWLGGVSQKHESNDGQSITLSGAADDSYTSRGWEAGGKVNVGPVSLVAHYYDGKGLDSQNQSVAGLQFLNGNRSDDDGGYVQAVWATPFGTKVGASWGRSNSKSNESNGQNGYFDRETESWMIGVYHPLTKSLNLVAEYTDASIEADSFETFTARTPIARDNFNRSTKVDTDVKQISLGAILFF